MSKTEMYYIHQIDSKTCRMTKETSGETGNTYIVGDSSCQCYQALRPARCRHMDIRQKWILRKVAPQSAIFNFRDDRFYLIEGAE